MPGRRRLKSGLFVGRFQPFHLGHGEAIKTLLQKVGEMVIIIGSTQRSHELENPFTCGERYTMINGAFRELGISKDKYHIIPVPDSPMHSMWVAQIVSYTPPFDTVYSNDPLTRRLFKESGFPIRNVPFYKRETFSATEVRRRMLAGEDWRDLVPKCVAAYIDEIDGVTRLRDLSQTDSPFGKRS